MKRKANTVIRNKEQIKLAFFGFGVMEQGGGFERYCIETAISLENHKSDIKPTIITANRQLLEKLQILLSLYYLRRRRKAIYRERSKAMMRRLENVGYIRAQSYKELKEELAGQDVIYTKNEVLELGLLRLFRFSKLPPVVVGIHTPLQYPTPNSIQDRLHNLLYTTGIYRWLLNKAKAVIVLNHSDQELLLSLKVRQVFMVPVGINQPKLTSHHAGSNLKILFAGRLSEQKGLELLLASIELLANAKSFPRMEFRIAGTGELKFVTMIKRLSKRFGNVTYMGHVDAEKVSKLYRWADITLIPSRYETLSRVAIEAGLHENIVVATNIVGPKEVIVDKVTGYLIDPKAHLFAGKMADLLELKTNNKQYFQEIGRAARNRLSKLYEPMASLDELQKIIRFAHDKS